VKPSSQSQILMIGNDPALTYLIRRYAQQSGYRVAAMPIVPQAAEVCAIKPAALLFPSVETLEAAQSLIVGLANCDIPVLVCSSVADEARARELGADYCLLHPLTYDSFLNALTETSTTQC
jgi:CheY-like chemotaxis protein